MGDKPGHVFRGNQYTKGKGLSKVGQFAIDNAGTIALGAAAAGLTAYGIYKPFTYSKKGAPLAHQVTHIAGYVDGIPYRKFGPPPKGAKVDVAKGVTKQFIKEYPKNKKHIVATGAGVAGGIGTVALNNNKNKNKKRT